MKKDVVPPKVVYRCEFTFRGEKRCVRSSEGIRFFTDGFWLNEDLQLTTASDNRFWIPPWQIEYIAKDYIK